MAEKLISQPRDFPAVEEILQDKSLDDLFRSLPRPLCVSIIRETIDIARKLLLQDGKPIPLASLLATISTQLAKASRNRISRVVNATGILIHTNLGRSPLSPGALDTLRESLSGYNNLEFNLETGERGSRGESCERYLAMIAEAEAAVVVNNCAAALFLILNTFANRKPVVISRGELVQIGGGFRIPDILRRSGARLIEIGTSNITSLADYEAALDGSTGLILKVHKSNFALSGFTDEVSLKSVADLGRAHNVMVVHDLGSGLVVPTAELLGHQEASVQQSVRDGASLTCFSADKMLGGPQAGVIVGRADEIDRLKKNPLFRTVRADKIIFALLEQTAGAYLDSRWKNDILLWRLAATPVEQLRSRAEAIIAQAGSPTGVTAVSSEAFMGGGSLPDQPLASVAIRFDRARDARKLIRKFRELNPPVIGRIAGDAFFLDLKAIDPSEDQLLSDAIAAVVSQLE
jgi:L-seryl-tRNA(Ser) seleniumtransferase